MDSNDFEQLLTNYENDLRKSLAGPATHHQREVVRHKSEAVVNLRRRLREMVSAEAATGIITDPAADGIRAARQDARDSETEQAMIPDTIE